MKKKTSRSDYINAYISDHYKRVSLNIPKEEYEKIRLAAVGKSISMFIKQAITEKLERDT